MSAAPKMCENPCDTCAKAGLPLLLTRYALMPAETGAPKLSGELDCVELKNIPLGQGAHYGLRLLRSGYVYVHDEARKRWDEYFVTADGFLTKMPPMIMAFKVQPIPATTFRCARNGAAPLAGVITIQNPKHASKVWIAFSNVQWTHSIWLRHEDATFRQKHMRCITISDGKVSTQPGTAPLESIKTHVTEFKMAQVSAAQAFGKWCPHLYNGRQQAGDALLKAVKQARPQGGAAIVALHDPVGLVQELASLAALRKNVYMNHASVSKPLFAASMIDTLEAQIKTQAKLAEMVASEDLAESMEHSPADYSTNAAMAGVPYSNPWAAEKIRESITPASLEAAANKKWRQYTHVARGQGASRVDAEGSKKWLKDHATRFKQFDEQSVAPLAHAHAAWMQHPRMVSHMSCNHDTQDLASGTAYTATVLEMIQQTDELMPCYGLYRRWLMDGRFNEQNLIMRALSLNQDKLAAAIEKTDKPSLDERAFPSDAIFGGIASHFGNLADEAKAVHSKLLAGLSGPAISYWDEFQSGKVSPAFAATISGASGKQIVRLPLVGNRSQLIEVYVRQIMLLNPNMVMNQNQLRQAVAAQTRLMQLQGVKMSEGRKLAWYVLLDAEAARSTLGATKAAGKSGQALARELAAAAMRSPQVVRDMELSAIGTMVKAGQKALASTVVGAVLMGWNYTKLEEDLASGMSHELKEATLKLYAGRVAVAGFVSEKMAEGIKSLGETRLKNSAGRFTTIAPQALRFVGRIAGLGAGVFVGMMDLSKVGNEAQKRDYGLALAYFVSGSAAMALALYSFFAASFGPAGWILLGVILLVTLYIEAQKDNKLQEWLSRCHFGMGTEKYQDQTKQLTEFRLAVQ